MGHRVANLLSISLAEHFEPREAFELEHEQLTRHRQTWGTQIQARDSRFEGKTSLHPLLWPCAIRRIDEHTAEIKRMYVKPAARGHGIGRLVLNALEEEGRRLGVSRIVLETGERNSEAMAMYSRRASPGSPRSGSTSDPH